MPTLFEKLNLKGQTEILVVNPPTHDASMTQLRRENARLKARLQQAELILEIQKKASEILGISLKTLDNERSD